MSDSSNSSSGNIIREALPAVLPKHVYSPSDFVPVPAGALRLVETIENGLTIAALDQFQQRTGLPTQRVAKLIRIPPRTLARRREEGHLSAEESDRLVRVSRVFANATNLFGGNIAAAVEWLSRPLLALGGVVPLDFAETETGTYEVERVIQQLVHGVFP